MNAQFADVMAADEAQIKELEDGICNLKADSGNGKEALDDAARTLVRGKLLSFNTRLQKHMDYEAEQLGKLREEKRAMITKLQAEISALESDFFFRMEACKTYHSEVAAKAVDLDPTPSVPTVVDDKARAMRREELFKNKFNQDFINGHGFKGLDVSTFQALFAIIEPVVLQLNQDASAHIGQATTAGLPQGSTASAAPAALPRPAEEPPGSHVRPMDAASEVLCQRSAEGEGEGEKAKLRRLEAGVAFIDDVPSGRRRWEGQCDGEDDEFL